MRNHCWLLGLPALLTLGACAPAQEREWMKIDRPYTTAEFRKDHEECSRGGKLDEACMKRRGWVSVNPGSRPDRTPPQQPYPGSGRPIP